MKEIYHFNLLYTTLRPLVEFATKCHYRRFVVHGKDHLPKNDSYIIAPNHQNAMMDPLVLLCTTHKSIVFLCRADIFANPVANFFLTWLKILPIYRIRDGKENLAKNEAIFDKSREVLLHQTPLCLYSEGRHNDKHQLLPLVKGMFRIAGDTQKELGDKPLYIVPTGLDYDDYERPFSNMVIHIGEPIDIRPFLHTYIENEAQALVQMREALTQSLTKQMHHVESKEHYDEFYSLSNIANRSVRRRKHRVNTAWNRFVTRKEITAEADKMEQNGDSRLEPLLANIQQYKALCHEMGLREPTVAERWSIPALAAATIVLLGIAAAAFTVPTAGRIILFLMACYPLIYLPTAIISQRIIKDTQFRSSINFAIRFGFALIYTIAFTIVSGCTHGVWVSELLPGVPGWGWAAITLGLSLLMAHVSGHLCTWLREFKENWHLRWLRITKRNKMRQLDQLQKEIEKTL